MEFLGALEAKKLTKQKWEQYCHLKINEIVKDKITLQNIELKEQNIQFL